MNEKQLKSKITNPEKLKVDQEGLMYIDAVKEGLIKKNTIHQYEHEYPIAAEKLKDVSAWNEILPKKEKVKKSLEVKAQKINEIVEHVGDIPEYIEKQIKNLGGDDSILEQKIEIEIKNPLQKIRDSVGNKFVKFAAIVGLTSLTHYSSSQETNSTEIKSVNKKFETSFATNEKDGQFLVRSLKYPKLFERFVRGKDGKIYSLGLEDEKGVTLNPEKKLNPERFVDPEKYAEEDMKSEMNGARWQRYLSKIYEIQQDPEHYVENKIKKDFDFLSTLEGVNSYKGDLEQELSFRLDRVAHLSFMKEKYPKGTSYDPTVNYGEELIRQEKLTANIKIELEKINNGTWKPSLEKLQQETQKDFDELLTEYDDDGLPLRKKNIDEVIKEASDYFDETKEYTQNRVARDQEMYNHYDSQLNWLNSNIKSPEYIKRIQNFEGLTLTDVQKRLLLLNKNDYEGTSTDMSESRVTTDLKTGKVLDAKFKLRYSKDKDDEHNYRMSAIHEGEHVATANEKYMSPYAVELYKKALNKDARVTVYGENDEKYIFHVNGSDGLSEPTELDARKKTTEYFMEQSGIKKYEEKFTKEHYEKLLELLKENKVPNDVRQFLEMIKSEYIEQIMNTIADNSNDQEGLNKINQT